MDKTGEYLQTSQPDQGPHGWQRETDERDITIFAYKAFELHMLGELGMWEEFVQNYPELAKAIERDNRDE